MRRCQLNNREAFDTVKGHLLTQMARSVNDSGECMYRGLEGRKCAVGCLIPDEEYDVRMERKRASVVRQSVRSLSGLDRGMLERLQVIHDSFDVETWEAKLDDEEKYSFPGAAL